MATAKDSATAKHRNRRIRQEALREQLSNQGHVQHVVDIATKLADQYDDLESQAITALKAAADIKLKLIAKYIPDLKSTEIVGEVEHSHKHTGLPEATLGLLGEITGQREDSSDKASKSH